MNSPSTISSKYFPQLDIIRFWGSIGIIIAHIEIAKKHVGQPNVAWVFNKTYIGFGLVNTFLTLSGFLITTLLIKEYSKTNRIHIGRFLIRRILRLWPLYYFALAVYFILALFIVPVNPDLTAFVDLGKSLKFWIHLVNFPDLANHPRGLGHLWSISLEEQFYLIWPFVIKWSKFLLTRLLPLLFLLALGKIILFQLLQNDKLIFPPQTRHFLTALWKAPYESLATGCLAALLFAKYPNAIIKMIFNTPAQIIFSLIFILTLVFGRQYGLPLFPAVIAVSVIILNASYNKNYLFSSPNKHIQFLGKHSYGLYVWHNIIIYSSLALINIRNEYSATSQLLFYLWVVVLTIVISILSMKIIEQPFLNLKNKFR